MYVFLSTSLCQIASCQPMVMLFWLHFAPQVLQFCVTRCVTWWHSAPVLPTWLLLQIDVQFLHTSSAFHLFLWLMEGKLKICLNLLKSYTWAWLIDLIDYGFVLAPVSLFMRLVAITLLSLGLMPDLRLY